MKQDDRSALTRTVSHLPSGPGRARLRISSSLAVALLALISVCSGASWADGAAVAISAVDERGRVALAVREGRDWPGILSRVPPEAKEIALTSVGARNVPTLIDCLRREPRISELSLIGSSEEKISRRHIEEVLRLGYLERLHLIGTEIGGFSVPQVEEPLRQLVDISLADESLQEGVTIGEDGLTSCTRLALVDVLVAPRDLVRLLDACSALETLTLNGLRIGGASQWRKVLLSASHSIQWLDVSETDFSDSELARLYYLVPGLRSVVARDTSVTLRLPDRERLRLLPLESVDLSGCSLCAKGLADLIINHPIHELLVRAVNVQPESLCRSGQIGASLRRLPALRSIDLSGAALPVGVLDALQAREAERVIMTNVRLTQDGWARLISVASKADVRTVVWRGEQQGVAALRAWLQNSGVDTIVCHVDSGLAQTAAWSSIVDLKTRRALGTRTRVLSLKFIVWSKLDEQGLQKQAEGVPNLEVSFDRRY